tara:strand:- start:1741 stop:2232 length:492 start_codon:yes stop_codon:yes gene_type:complete
MKNNTKLIMETWRRFLSEGPQDDPGQFKDPGDPDLEGAQVTDSDLEGDIALVDQMNSDPFHDEYNPQGVGESEPLPSSMYGGTTHEERVQAVVDRLMLDPTDPLHGFTAKEEEDGRVRVEEEMPDSMEDMHTKLSDETGGGYDSASAGAELASFGRDEPMDDY